MEFIEGSRGIYRPIRVLFDTPIYERSLQTCWHTGSYKSQIALVTQLLRLQQKNQLPSEVTAEDMTELLVEQSKSTLRVQLWEFELEDFDEGEARPLLKLAWEVNTRMKMRDVEFEARRLLDSPEAVPPQFQHPKIISQAQQYARSLTEQQQEAPSSKQLGPREVVMEVVPKVLQGFWVPPPNTSFNMPSQQLSQMAVGVTKAVEDQVSNALSSMFRQVTFSRSIRDDMVLSIQEKVKQGHTRDVLRKRLRCFAAEVLNTISDVAAREICVLFQPRTNRKVSVIMNTRKDCIQPADVVDGAEARTSPAEDVNEETGLEEDTEPIREPDSAVTTPPPAPLTTSAEPLSNSAVQNDLNLSLRETEEQPAPEPDSAVVSSPPLPLILCDEPLVITAVQEDLVTTVFHNDWNNSLDEAVGQSLPSSEPNSAVINTPSASVTATDELPVITAVQDDLTSSAEPPANAPVHNGLNNSLHDTEEEPTLNLKPVFSVLSPQPAPLTLPAETPANIGLDEAEEQLVPSSEPDSAVTTTPPSRLTPADESPVITAVQNDLTTSAEPPANSTTHNCLNSSLDEVEEQPAPSSEPDSAVVSTPPPPLTPADDPPVFTAVQDELIVMEQPVRVDESFNTATKVKKTKMSGFSCFFRRLKKSICCCFLPEDDTELL